MNALTRRTLLVTDAFVAITAITGGLLLAAGLEAGRFPLDWLGGTPFDSYFAPGLILAVVGGSAAIAAFAVLLRPHAGASASVVAGAIMMGWISGEVLLLNQPSWTWIEAFYFCVGAAMVALGLVLWRDRSV